MGRNMALNKVLIKLATEPKTKTVINIASKVIPVAIVMAIMSRIEPLEGDEIPDAEAF